MTSSNDDPVATARSRDAGLAADDASRVVAPLGQQSTATAARLVGRGFRNLTLGWRSGDLSCWEIAFAEYAAHLGPDRGAVAFAGLASWVRSISASSCRSIEVAPIGCETLCRDECMAVSIIAACQHSHCPALHACIHALIDRAFVGNVAEESHSFAACLKQVDVIVPENVVIDRTLDTRRPACARIH